MKVCEWEAQETPLLRQNEYLTNCVSTSSSSTKHENLDFYVPTLSTIVKRSPAVGMFTCSYCVFIIKLIVLSCSRRHRRPGILRPMQTDATSHNIVRPTMLEVVGTCKQTQQLSLRRVVILVLNRKFHY